mmetsp:Transcript_22393/g.27651  ORF Transcript_22393/g.27651 Transcript_22393/m.27651 type:complete len:187 (-) Transcript_22393:109-669(-)
MNHPYHKTLRHIIDMSTANLLASRRTAVQTQYSNQRHRFHYDTNSHRNMDNTCDDTDEYLHWSSSKQHTLKMNDKADSTRSLIDNNVEAALRRDSRFCEVDGLFMINPNKRSDEERWNDRIKRRFHQMKRAVVPGKFPTPKKYNSSHHGLSKHRSCDDVVGDSLKYSLDNKLDCTYKRNSVFGMTA